MRKKKLAFIPLIFSILFFLKYKFDGSKIDENGYVIESFYCLGLAYLFLILFFAVLFVIILNFYNKNGDI